MAETATFHGTTIQSVRRGNHVALGGDGQVTLGSVVIKASARKVRRLYQDKILAGFAGGTADAFTLFERFEAKLEKHQARHGDTGLRAMPLLVSNPLCRFWLLLPHFGFDNSRTPTQPVACSS